MNSAWTDVFFFYYVVNVTFIVGIIKVSLRLVCSSFHHTERKLCSTQQSFAICPIIKVKTLFTCSWVCLLLCKQVSPHLCKRKKNVGAELSSILKSYLFSFSRYCRSILLALEYSFNLKYCIAGLYYRIKLLMHSFVLYYWKACQQWSHWGYNGDG